MAEQVLAPFARRAVPRAERLQRRLVFRQRSGEADEYGSVVGTFVDRFESRAELIIPGPGNEAVTGARLEGRQPLTIRVRYNSQTVQIQADWEAVDASNRAIVYAVRAPPMDREQSRRWLEIPAVIGEAS